MFTTIKQGEKVLAFCSYLHNATSYINIQSQSICTTVPARWQMNTFQIPKSLKPSCSNLNGNETCLLHNITQLKMATAELEQRDGSSQHNYSSPIRFTPGNQPKLSKRRRGYTLAYLGVEESLAQDKMMWVELSTLTSRSSSLPFCIASAHGRVMSWFNTKQNCHSWWQNAHTKLISHGLHTIEVSSNHHKNKNN